MIDLLQSMPGAGKNDDQMAAARNIWKALDDMAEADPEQYNKFIQQQMHQAKDLGLQKPATHPGVVLTASVESKSSTKAAVVSLFENEQIPQPSEAGKPWNPQSVQLQNMQIEFRVRSCLACHTRSAACLHLLSHTLTTEPEGAILGEGPGWRSMCV